MTRIVCLIAAAGILVAAAVAHGLRTDRWGARADLVAAVARLDQVPTKLGEWDGSEVKIDERQIAAAQAVGYLSRRYVHRSSAQEVTILLLCGRPGPISVHTPEICYGGIGYRAGPQEKRELSGSSVWTALFTKEGPSPDTLRINWTWNDGRGWQAADSPRISFARSSVAYKLYVQRHVRPNESFEGDPSRDFLALLLPELQKCLFPES